MANAIRCGIFKAMIGLSNKPIRRFSMEIYQKSGNQGIYVPSTVITSYKHVIPINSLVPLAQVIKLPALERNELKCKKKNKEDCWERKHKDTVDDCPMRKVKKGYYKPARETHPCHPHGDFNDDPCDPWEGTRRSCKYKRMQKCLRRKRGREMLGKTYPCKCR